MDISRGFRRLSMLAALIGFLVGLWTLFPASDQYTPKNVCEFSEDPTCASVASRYLSDPIAPNLTFVTKLLNNTRFIRLSFEDQEEVFVMVAGKHDPGFARLPNGDKRVLADEVIRKKYEPPHQEPVWAKLFALLASTAIPGFFVLCVGWIVAGFQKPKTSG
jgi:hypothetical protein